jgi:TusA-related sulfurtransferase
MRVIVKSGRKKMKTSEALKLLLNTPIVRRIVRKRMNKLKPGDIIQCVDKEDMVQTMMLLAQEDIETEFVYEKNGAKGYWLEVIKVE